MVTMSVAESCFIKNFKLKLFVPSDTFPVGSDNKQQQITDGD